MAHEVGCDDDVVCCLVELLYSFAPNSDGSLVCGGESKPALFVSENGETTVPFTYSVSWSVRSFHLLFVMPTDMLIRNPRRRGYEIMARTIENLSDSCSGYQI